jgi:alanyl aminopeptidase
MDWDVRTASCPAWLDANSGAKGYYRVDYSNALLAKLTGGDVVSRLTAAERVDLIGNAQAMAEAGKLPAADALGMAESFHADPERQVVQRALDVALSVRDEEVPPALLPNYKRFLLRNFQARARALGWTPKPGETDDERLLRPALVRPVATFGGDQELAGQARELADRWLTDRSAVNPEVAGDVLRTAAYYGDLSLFNRYLAEFEKTQDRQDRQRLLTAMRAFRDPLAVKAAFEAVLDRKIAFADSFPLLFSGEDFAETRKLSFEFIKAHFDQIVSGHPSIFGNDLGGYLPQSGASFCDAQSKDELRAFFEPRVAQFVGAPRTLTQVLESVDLCIARKTAQEPSVKAFLEKQ